MTKHPRRRSPIEIGVDRLEARSLLSGFTPIDHSRPAVPAAISQFDQGTGHTELSPALAAPTVRRWSWLAGSYWYVPYRNLPAVYNVGSTGTLIPVADQTVFQVTGYRDGYFWGKVVTQLDSSSTTGSSLVGSVTPQGRVLLNFTVMGTGSSPTVTEGYGTMERKRGGWTMENQMFSTPGSPIQLGHWAYMVQTHPGLPSWNSLPGSGLSVPEFLDLVPGTGTEPIVPAT